MAKNTEWSLDIREHAFDDTGALHRALCCSTSLVSLNSLSLEDASDNFNLLLRRDRSQMPALFVSDGF